MSPTASRNDWFVAVDSGSSGDGSREKPFHDPWKAIRSAAPGDVIHIAAGIYFGRYDRSSWIIDCPNLTVRGGYSRDFSTRTPWKTPSVFAFFAGYEAPRDDNMIGGRGDHAGLTLDGLMFDAAAANTYGDKPFSAISNYPTMTGAIASFDAELVTIRNCIFANGANGGIELSGSSSRFENNLLLNLIGLSMLELRSSTALIEKPITVCNNSFCFIHDIQDPPGGGGDDAIGVRIHCPAVVQGNVFISCGNAGISVLLDPARVSIDRNLFFLTPRALVVSRAQDNSGEITESNLDELEDIGFKSCADNTVQNPGIAGLRPEWLDAYSRHLLANYVKPPRQTANAVRTAAGLPVLDPPDLEKSENKGAFAPRFAVPDALALSFTTKQGFQAVKLEAEISANISPPPLSYRTVDWNAINALDASLGNTRVELRAGLGSEQNTTLLPDATPETHMGVRIFEPGSDDSSIYVLIPRNHLPARQFQEAITYTDGSEVERAYWVRGVYRTDVQSWQQKVTIIVESITPASIPAATPERPVGRDWFVRAGSSGGDGSREKPFRDPFQALDKAEGGDSIHVAAGDYFGKLHSGKWRISIRNLTLLGGYNGDFSARDPWGSPTRFVLHEDEKSKGRPEGTILGSEDNSEGLIVDGFMFDGATWNTYAAGGSLDIDRSPLAPLVSLSGGRAPITMRNCVFVNGSSGAVKVACPFGVFENNIVLNTSGASLVIQADGPGPWTVRHNSFLFAADPTDRAGTGKSSSDGTLLHLNGRAAVDVDSNIFAFADNFGVRSSVPQQNVSFNDNVFAANLFNHLTDTNHLWADSSNWERRAVGDSEFASFARNTLDLPKLPVDPGFANAVLLRLFALPSRISKDQWKLASARIGSSATPVSPVEPAPVEPVKPAAQSTAPSLNDLLAKLSHLETARKQAEVSGPKIESATPVYCPVFDWQKTPALGQTSPAAAPGAHRSELNVAYTGSQSSAAIEYMRLTPEDINTNNPTMDNKSIELDVTEMRDASTNLSFFPSGTDKNNYTACSVTALEGPSRKRIAIVVKLDTAAYKLLNRMTPTDKIRVRGTARTAQDSQIFSVIVDTVTPLES